VRLLYGVAVAALLAPAAALRELPPASSLAGLDPAIREQLLEARAAVERLAETSGDLAAAYGALGELYLVYDLVADAEPCLENAAAMASRDPRWPYLLGVLRQGRRESAAAESAFRAALALAPSDLPALLRLGDVLLGQSRAREARDLFARALAIELESAAALEGLGRVAWSENDYRAAIERFERALALQPEATSLHYRLGLAYRALGDLEQARAQMARSGDRPVTFADPVLDAARRRLTGVGALLRVGQLAAMSAAPAVAEARFREALAINPSSPDAHHALGTLLEAQGRTDEALAHYVEAMRLGLQNVPAGRHTAVLLFHRAGVEAEAGRGAEAEASLREALDLDPDLAEAHYNLGTLYARRGALDQAATHLGRAAELRPDDGSVQLSLAMALLLSDRALEALQRLEAALERRAGQLPLEHLLARLLAASSAPAVRDAERALTLTRELVEAQPSADHLETLAMSFAAGSRFAEAAQWQERAIEAIEAADSGDLELARRRLELYRDGRPVLDPWKK
jgi:tetratricopeptide (TPR) repeat protein